MIRILYSFLSLLMGSWFLFDGIHVLIYGKYFGPPEPGPWSRAVSLMGINPFSMGIPFVFMGLLWLIGLFGVLSGNSWGFYTALFISIGSLWYLPIGTLLSIFVLILLVFWKNTILQ